MPPGFLVRALIRQGQFTRRKAFGRTRRLKFPTFSKCKTTQQEKWQWSVPRSSRQQRKKDPRLQTGRGNRQTREACDLWPLLLKQMQRAKDSADLSFLEHSAACVGAHVHPPLTFPANFSNRLLSWLSSCSTSLGRG